MRHFDFFAHILDRPAHFFSHECRLAIFNRFLAMPNEEQPDPGMSINFVVENLVYPLQGGQATDCFEQSTLHVRNDGRFFDHHSAID